MDGKYEVVISGIGGKFPQCEGLEEFQKSLFDKINLVTIDDQRWPPGEMGVPASLGKLKDIHYFDTTFFGIHRKLCDSMDGLTKLAMERAYEAILDSGVNPSELNGSDTAVIMASCISESEIYDIFDSRKQGFGILGHNRSMQANRISYILNLTGPSFAMDSSWSGGIQGLQMAFDMVSNGHCSSALVGSCNLTLQPDVSLLFLSMGKLNYSGNTKSFSADADGYARAEGCVTFFLQRADDAKRSYGTIVNISSEVIGSRDVPFLDIQAQDLEHFLEETYSEANVDPSSVAFLEADGSGIKSMDAMELNAVAKVMCKNRKDPLLVGSVKSNAGHTEATSSMVSVVKALIALDQDLIPPNLHYSAPNPAVPELLSGKIKVVTEATPLPGNIVGVTSFGIAGGLGHVILKQNPKKKRSTLPKDNADGLPRLFIASARDENGIVRILDKVSGMPVDEEFLALSNEVWTKNIQGHLHRGYVVLPPVDPPERENMPVSGGKQRPIWFIFSGMGSQWIGMGTHLLKLPVFEAAIQKCQAALKPKGIDVLEIITSQDPKIFDNILNSFVGIAAIQIGLVDVLYALGIKPDGMIGHSVGELGCAYADGCFTAEQMILSAYARGKASIETPLIKGMMAAVGLGYQQMKNEKLPESIDVACHNSSDSCTLSGPAEDMEKYIAELKERKIFAKLVNVADIAYHSRYIVTAAPALLEYLKDVVVDPKPRSEKWISSSVPESEWNTELAKYSSSEYFANNLLSPVLFEEVTKCIPNNSVTIEIAPHGLLQAILRRSLKDDCTNIALTKRASKNGLRFLLSAIGKLFMSGLLPDVGKIFSPVEFPVSRATAPLHSLVSWEHTEKWSFGSVNFVFGFISGERQIEINFNYDMWQIYLEHNLSNHHVVPTAAFLIFAWESLISFKKESQFLEPVIFDNVRVNSIVEVSPKSSLNLYIFIQRGSGNWEISMGDKIVATGRIRTADRAFDKIDEELSETNLPKCDKNVSDVGYRESDIYNIFEQCDLVHKDSFRTIKHLHVNNEGFYGGVTFNNNWVQFLDGILKMHAFLMAEKTNQLHFPTYIRRLIIDPSKFTPGSVVEFTNNKATGITAAPGIKLSGVRVENTLSIPFSDSTALYLEEYKFLSHSSFDVQNIEHLLNGSAQFILENFIKSGKGKKNISIIELESSAEDPTISSQIDRILKKHLDVEVIHVSVDDNTDLKSSQLSSNLLVGSDSNHISQAYEILKNKNGYLLAYTNDVKNIKNCPHSNISIVFQGNIVGRKFTFFKKVKNIVDKKWYGVCTTDPNWSIELHKLKTEIDNADSIIYLIVYGEPLRGVHGFVRSVESCSDNLPIRYIFLLDKNCPSFSPTSSFYANQIALDLKINVYKNGNWGSFYKIPLKEVITDDEQMTNVTQLHRLKSRHVKINYFGLNLKSVAMTEEGNLCQNDIGPLDYSGVNNESGEQVMGLAAMEAGMVHLNPDPILNWIKPTEWSLEDAVTVPFVYSLAYYALIEAGQLKANEKVLIHCGYTAIGQAAISIALKKECDIFVTYFNPEQAALIKSKFPDITDDNLVILDCNYDVKLMLKKKGSGVDVVFNCFGGNTNFLQNSLECLNFCGRFLHLGQTSKDITSSFGMFVFLKAVSFYGINLENLLKFSNETKNRITMLVQEGIEDGTVKPLEKVINFGCCTDKDAVEFISSLNLTDPGKKAVHCVISEKEMVKKDVSGLFLCDPEKSYIIFGGNTALWLDVVSWLCERGARNFVIGIDDQSMSSTIARRFTILISQYSSCKIQLATKVSIKSEKEADDFISRTFSLGPLDGMFFIYVSDASKIYFCDKASRKLKTNISVFVSLMSNGDAVCENRKINGFPGITVNWDKGFSHPSKILSAFDEILRSDKEYFIISEQKFHGSTEQNELSSVQIAKYIPESVEELSAYGEQITECCFTEVQTLSPPYSELKDISPVFIIPGFKPNQLNKFVSRLLYPAFVAKLPVDICSVDEAATNLIQVLTSFPKLDAFTLIGCGWGGMIALKIASILDAENKTTTVILLDAEPNAVQRWASTMKEDMNLQLLSKYFNLNSQMENELSVKSEWEDCLDIVSKHVKSSYSVSDLNRGLTALKNRLTAVLNFNFKNINKLKNTLLYLYRPDSSLDTITNLSSLSTSGKVIICNEVDFQSMIESKNIVQSVNDNLLFYYPDTKILSEKLKEISNGIKKNISLSSVIS